MEPNTFGTRLKAVLQEKGLTQRELSRRTGIAESTISRYIDDTRKPGNGNLKKLSGTLDIPVRILSGMESDRERIIRTIRECKKNLTREDKKEIRKALK